MESRERAPESKIKVLIFRCLRWVFGVFFLLGFFLPLNVPFVSPFTVLSGMLGIFLFVLPLLHLLIRRIFPRAGVRIWRALSLLFVLIIVFFAVESAVILSGFRRGPEPEDAVVIVFGAQVIGHAPTTELMGRIHAAGTYLQNHPEAVCIASGGQGADEIITEASCIKRVLVNSYKIDESRIYEEDRSTNTMENILFSKEIMEGENLSENVVLVTSDYHMFRTKLLAERAGLSVVGYPAPMDERFFIAAFLRELLALPKSVVFDH